MRALRVATAADAPAIARVEVQAWRETYAGILPAAYLAALDEEERADRWLAWIAEPLSTAFVIEERGDVVGFASAGAARDDAPPGYDAEIYAIYVLRQAQGKGIGRALFDAARGSTGHRALVVWALERNPWRAFYEKLGGRVVATKETDVGGARVTEVAYAWD